MNILKTTFNSIHGLRHRLHSTSTDQLCFDGKYLAKTFFSRGNGLLQSLLGKVQYEGEYRPFLVSPQTRFQFETGSAIVISDGDQNISLSDPYHQFIPTASALGFVPYWKFLNPPTSRPTTLRMQKSSRLVLHPNSLVYPGAYLSIWPGQTLSIGRNTGIGTDVYINTRCGLHIGNNIMLGHHVTIMDYDGHPVFYEGKPALQDTYGGDAKPIVIEDDVWIGFGSVILKGVRIGKGSMIGANSCVTKDVPANSIVGGNPAKIIRENVTWKRF